MRYVLFPYERVSREANVVIYGMGWLGKLFVQQIQSNKYCNIAYAVDKNSAKISGYKIPIIHSDKLQDGDYDAVVIAILDSDVANQVARELKGRGIPSAKLIYGFDVLEAEDQEGAMSVMSRLNRIEWLLNEPVCRMLYGLESYVQNKMISREILEEAEKSLWHKPRMISELLKVYEFSQNEAKSPSSEFIRMGTERDGGYLVVDQDVPEQDRILYSFGVGGDVSFEIDMARRGYEAYIYDHTVEGLPEQNEKCHFFKQGLSGVSQPGQDVFYSLPELLHRNGHTARNNMFLKMDIEGAELEVFANLPREIQQQFSQIVLEIHGLTAESAWDDIITALESLNTTHRLVHLHANNYSRVAYYGNQCISDVVEATYVLNKDYDFKPRKGLLTREMDVPCDLRYRTERVLWQ